MIAAAFQTSHRQFGLIRIAFRNTHRERMPSPLFRFRLRLQTDAENRPANQNRSPHLSYRRASRGFYPDLIRTVPNMVLCQRCIVSRLDC
jgi:hypothetical protein